MFRYNEQDQKTYEQERDGVTAEWMYDSAGRCVEVKRAGIRIWEGSYDEHGLLRWSKEAGVAEKRYSYDENTFISCIRIREEGRELSERYTHDGIGRVVRYEDAAGQVWTYEYRAKTVTERYCGKAEL